MDSIAQFQRHSRHVRSVLIAVAENQRDDAVAKLEVTTRNSSIFVIVPYEWSYLDKAFDRRDVPSP